MIEHVVLFKFDEMTTKEQKDEAISGLLALRDTVPGIVDLCCNYVFSEQNKGFEIALTVRLESKQTLHDYENDPKHQEVLSYLKNVGLNDVLVIDFEI